MKRIIYTRPDGDLYVIHPCRNTHPVLENLSDDQVLERAKKDIPSDAINPQIVEETDIPTDRTFRNAWVAGDKKVDYDMNKARKIQKQKLRDYRKPILEALDVQFMKALEKGESTTEISKKKQVLRDITSHPDIEAAQTPKALKSVWPFDE